MRAAAVATHALKLKARDGTACHPKSAGSGTRDKRPNADGNVIDPEGRCHAVDRAPRRRW